MKPTTDQRLIARKTLKIIFIPFVVFYLLAFQLHPISTNKSIVASLENTDSIYAKCDVPPTFKGGNDSLIAFLGKMIIYPDTLKKLGIEGNVMVRFIVDKEGQITDPLVIRRFFTKKGPDGQKQNLSPTDSISQLLVAESLRVLRIMPTWEPGKMDGQNVSAYSVMPFSFVYMSPSEQEQLEKTSFYVVEEMPEFPGGVDKLLSYLTTNMNYPESCKKKKIEGYSKVKFIISTDGSIKDISLAKSSGNSLLDEEAIRLVQSMPKWKPGKQSGRNVPVTYLLPIRFSLNQKPLDPNQLININLN